jgi:soluble lytic murein transglycosylase
MRISTRVALAWSLAAGLYAASPDPAITRLGQAVAAYDKKDFFTAAHLLTAGGQPAKLRDYVAYFLANAELVTNNGDSAVRDLERYEANPVTGSPLAGRIGLLYAKALLGETRSTPATAAKARQILETDYTLLPQPDGDFTLAQAFQSTGFPRQSAVYFERVYYMHPASDLADRAKAALDKLRTIVGADFPEATPRQRLDRAKAWLTAKQYAKARQEYAMLTGELTGAFRDEAQSGVGAALFLDGDAAGAASYLANFHPEGPRPESDDAAAQRLYYMTEAYRRLNDDAAMLDAVHQLDEHYPVSPWRLKALISAGYRYLATQERAQYVPLYQAAAASFPGDSSAALCQWRVTWAAWLDHSPQRVQLLKEQIERFPSETHVSDAMFFLGRAAEQESDFATARTYYERLNAYYPHYYYAGLARTKLTEPKIATAKEDTAVLSWLEQTVGVAHAAAIPPDIMSIPNGATRQRIERGRLLITADMTAQAVEELEFGAKQVDEQPTLLAMELSHSMPTPYLALKEMKRFAGDYLSLPFDKASRTFWEMLFPMPYQETVTASATARDLDPYSVAGLIRQESEFNPTAKSAVAYGLMQVIPSTGKMLGRMEGIQVSSASMLFNPDLNIRLGTQYLRSELDHWQGDWVKTLAAYNAGPTRVRQWLNQFGYDDSSEFIENIPFNETRDYVQAVLRNGQVYRQLYGRDKAILASDTEDDSAVPAAKITDVAAVNKAVVKKPARIAISKRAAAKTKTTAKPGVAARPASGSSGKPATAGAKAPTGKSAASAKKPAATSPAQTQAQKRAAA